MKYAQIQLRECFTRERAAKAVITLERSFALGSKGEL